MHDRREVGQGANRGQGWSVGGAEEEAGGGQGEGVFYCDQRHASLVESCSQEAIRAANESGCSRSVAISTQDCADILFPTDRGVFHDLWSAFRVAKRGALNAQGVTVVADAGERRLAHGTAVKDVVPYG